MVDPRRLSLVSSLIIIVMFQLLGHFREMSLNPERDAPIKKKFIPADELKPIRPIIEFFTALLGGFGQFFFLLFIIDMVAVSSLFSLYLTGSGPVFTVPNTALSVFRQCLAFSFSLLWAFFPALAMDEYEQIRLNGISPISFGIYSTLTLCFALLSLTSMEFFFRGLFPLSIIASLAGGGMVALSFYKNKKFLQFLSEEYKEVEYTSQKVAS